MKLENELTCDKGASFALAWAFTWRWFILMLIIGISICYLKSAVGDSEYTWMPAFVEFFLLVLAMWLVVNHVLNKGFARIKVVIMEEKYHKEMLENKIDQ